MRKIVRNQSKMIPRPFSELNGPRPKWKNTTNHQMLSDNEAFNFPGVAQAKTVFHNLQRPKQTTYTSKGKVSYSSIKITKPETANELRTSVNMPKDNNIGMYTPVQLPTKSPNNISDDQNNLKVAIKNYYQIPTPSRFFPPVEQEPNGQSQRVSSKESTILIPPDTTKAKEALQVKGILIPNAKLTTTSDALAGPRGTVHSIIDIDPDNEKADFLIEGLPMDSTMFSYNLTSDPFTCSVIKVALADLDAQEKFSQLNIEVRSAVVGRCKIETLDRLPPLTQV